MFADNAAAFRADADFISWLATNPWVRAYGAFVALKRERGGAAWASWGEMANPAEKDISSYWKDHETECLGAAWIQYHLERQLSLASRSLQKRGVFLKGDVPILMSRESADVWASRRYFDLDALAGAPPDMFSPKGQNWGFPVYDWESLGADGHAWWKDRLLQAGKFFHALRVDHVLGFFRIWRIPRNEVTGLLGHFSPSAGMDAEDLRKLGFDTGRIRWLTLPHITGKELETALGSDAPRIARAYLSRIGSEDMYNLSEALRFRSSSPGAGGPSGRQGLPHFPPRRQDFPGGRERNMLSLVVHRHDEGFSQPERRGEVDAERASFRGAAGSRSRYGRAGAGRSSRC